MTAYTVDLLIALAAGKRLSKKWWAERYQWGVVRAGGMPPEIAEPMLATLARVVDPDTGDRFARVTLPLPEGTGVGRARELAHMLTSVLGGEGYTLRGDGTLVDGTFVVDESEPAGEFGGMDYTEARVYSQRCLSCVFAGETRLGCCGQGAAFSLADIGSVLLNGGEELVRRVLALPGQMDEEKWHPFLTEGRCIFHAPSSGCTLPRHHMPLQCRTYLCAPDKLLTPDVLADYTPYVDALEEAETFVEEHMREESGVDFGSPLEALREAAARAFAAWEAGKAKAMPPHGRSPADAIGHKAYPGAAVKPPKG